MAKRFKLRICRVITTTLQSCRSKDPSDLPRDPVPSFSTAFNHHHISSAFISINCALPPAEWHVVSNSDADDPPPSLVEKKNRRRRKKKKKLPSRLRLRTSSADSGWFSSDGAAAVEETETLVSSSPNSSSEFNRLRPIGETEALPRKRRTKRRAAATEGDQTPARLSVFKKLIPCTVDGKVKESFAIVKKSEDPYEDFKRSMMDMILEKQMFEQKDLEQLLQCFLSLNSRQYHRIIVEAFSEIWEAIFSPAD